MHTLTIKGFSLAGTPDTGDLVQLFNVDDTTLISRRPALASSTTAW